MTFRANGLWTASLIGLGLPLVACSSSERIEQIDVLRASDGPFGALIPLFEAKADGPYAFLNENEFLSSDPGEGSGGVSITFYERQ